MFTIRTATVSDVDTVVHHRCEMYRSMGYADEQALEHVVDNCRPFFQSALADGSYRAWMAVIAGGKIVGGGGVGLIPWPGNPRDPRCRRAIILNMYVEPEFRRRGIARALMQTMIDWCRAEGLVTVDLHASDEGRLLYESMGFKPTNEMRLSL